MPSTSRDATTHWTGGLRDGTGHVTLDSSNSGQFEVTFPSRFESPDGKTSPEELIAAAHSACLAMNLSGVLGQEGITADSIDVSAEVTLSTTAGGAEISGIDITCGGGARPGRGPVRRAGLDGRAHLPSQQGPRRHQDHPRRRPGLIVPGRRPGAPGQQLTRPGPSVFGPDQDEAGGVSASAGIPRPTHPARPGQARLRPVQAAKTAAGPPTLRPSPAREAVRRRRVGRG